MSRIEIAKLNGISHRREGNLRIFQKGDLILERHFLVDISLKKMESVFGILQNAETWD